LPPTEYLIDSIVFPHGIDRTRRHIVLNDGYAQWTSILAFFSQTLIELTTSCVRSPCQGDDSYIETDRDRRDGRGTLPSDTATVRASPRGIVGAPNHYGLERSAVPETACSPCETRYSSAKGNGLVAAISIQVKFRLRIRPASCSEPEVRRALGQFPFGSDQVASSSGGRMNVPSS